LKFVAKDEVKKIGRKLIETKTIFKKKDGPDGTIRYKNRIVLRDICKSQVWMLLRSFVRLQLIHQSKLLNVFFWDNHGWRVRGLNVEAAFLEGKLQKKYYVEPPDMLKLLGFMTNEDLNSYCIELQNGIYGQVDAALRFFVRFVGHLVNKKMQRYYSGKSRFLCVL